MNIYGTCLSKFTNQLKTNNPHIITKVLSHLRNVIINIYIHSNYKKLYS